MFNSGTPWTAACQASLSVTSSRSLLKLMSIESVMPSNHLILWCPLLLQPSIFPSIRVFSKESVLRIRWPKMCESQIPNLIPLLQRPIFFFFFFGFGFGVGWSVPFVLFCFLICYLRASHAPLPGPSAAGCPRGGHASLSCRHSLSCHHPGWRSLPSTHPRNGKWASARTIAHQEVFPSWEMEPINAAPQAQPCLGCWGVLGKISALWPCSGEAGGHTTAHHTLTVTVGMYPQGPDAQGREIGFPWLGLGNQWEGGRASPPFRDRVLSHPCSPGSLPEDSEKEELVIWSQVRRGILGPSCD